MDVGLALVGAAGDLRRRLDQAPAQTSLDDDLGVVLDVGRRRHASGQFRQVDDAARLVELTAAFQLLAHRQLIDGIIALVEGDHGGVYAPVRAVVERLVVEQFDGPPHGASVDQHGAEDGLLHLHRLRRHTVQVRAVRRGSSPPRGRPVVPSFVTVSWRTVHLLVTVVCRRTDAAPTLRLPRRLVCSRGCAAGPPDGR